MSKYYYINDLGNIIETIYENSNLDNLRYEMGNFFLTEKDARNALEKVKIYVELKRYANKNNDEEMNWEDMGQRKYFTTYNHYFKKLGNGIDTCLEVMGQVHFNDDKTREKAIKDIGEEKIKKLFKGDK